MNGHAPGPWIFYADLPSTEPNWHIVTTANRMRVLANVHINPDSAMDIANARLIAASPSLLSIAERWAAIDGGAWHVVRHAAELKELKADTLAAIAIAKAAEFLAVFPQIAPPKAIEPMPGFPLSDDEE